MANVPDLVVTVKNSGVRSTVISSPGGAAMKLVQLDDVTPLPRANGDVLTWISANGKFEFHPGTGSGTGSDQFARDNSNAAFSKANTANVTAQAAFNKANGAVQVGFVTVNVAGQANVVADSNTDMLTLIAGTGMTLTTDAPNDTITFTSTGGAGLSVGLSYAMASGYGMP
jgi:hypothetical protein